MTPPAKPLRGAIRVPGDKSIGHRALLLGALAHGTSRFTHLSDGEDNRATRRALEAMGVAIRDTGDGSVEIDGVGLDGLRAPSAAIDCGNSGTTMRLLAGLLAAQHFDATLVGDASLTRRPMARVARPLRNRGARIDGVFDARRNDEVAPLSIRGLAPNARLNELELQLDVASAQVKSALLLSGLTANGITAVAEPVVSRDHTERMLDAMGAPVRTFGSAVLFDPDGWDGILAPLAAEIAGDPSSAAFVVVAAHAVHASRVIVRGVCVNPTRFGAYDVLRDMGGGVIVNPKGASGGEPVGDLHVGAYESAELRQRARVGGELAVRAIDEIPILVAAAALTRGVSEFRDVGELRVKETDRIAALAAMLASFGVGHEVLSDGLRVEGGGVVRGGARVASFGDHRIAMSAAVLALRADGETVIDDVACVETSYPGFVRDMNALGATITIEDAR